MADDSSASKSDAQMPRGRTGRRLRRAGCGCLVVVAAVILGAYFFGDMLFRRVAEDRATQALGVPVRIGRLRVLLFGDAGVSLDRVRVGQGEGLVRAEHVRVDVDGALSLLGDRVVAQVDARGVTVAVPDDPWTEGGDLAILARNLGGAAQPSEGAEEAAPSWAVSDVRVRGLELRMPGPSAQGTVAQCNTLELGGLAADRLQDASTALRVTVGGATLTEGETERLRVATCEATLTPTSAGGWRVQTLTVDEPSCQDELTAPGRTRLRAIGDYLAELAAQAPLSSAHESTGSASQAHALDLTVKSAEIKNLDLRLADVRGGEDRGRILLTAALVGLQDLAAPGPDGMPTGSVRAEDLAVETRQGAHLASIELDAASLALESSGEANLQLQTELQGLGARVTDGPSASSVDGERFEVRALLRGQGPPALEAVTLRGLEAELDMRAGEGPTAPNVLAQLATDWREAFAMQVQEAPAASAGLGPPARFDLRDARVRLVDKGTDPGPASLELSCAALGLDAKSGDSRPGGFQDGELTVEDGALTLSVGQETLWAGRAARASVASLRTDTSRGSIAGQLSVKDVQVHCGAQEGEAALRCTSADLTLAPQEDAGPTVEQAQLGELRLALRMDTQGRLRARRMLDRTAALARAYLPGGDPAQRPRPAAAPALSRIRDARVERVRVDVRDAQGAEVLLACELGGLAIEDVEAGGTGVRAARLSVQTARLDVSAAQGPDARFEAEGLAVDRAAYALSANAEPMAVGFEAIRFGPPDAQTAFVRSGPMAATVASLEPVHMTELTWQGLETRLARTESGAWDAVQAVGAVRARAQTLLHAAGLAPETRTEAAAAAAPALSLDQATLNDFTHGLHLPAAGNEPEATLTVRPGTVELQGLRLGGRKDPALTLLRAQAPRLELSDDQGRTHVLAPDAFAAASTGAPGSRTEPTPELNADPADGLRLAAQAGTFHIATDEGEHTLADLGELRVTLASSPGPGLHIRTLDWRGARSWMTIDADHRTDLSDAVAAFGRVLSRLSPPDESASAPPTPVRVDEATVEDVRCTVTDHPGGSADRPARYALRVRSAAAERIALHARGTGRILADMAVAPPEEEAPAERMGDLSVAIRELDLSQGLARADFGVRMALEDLPARLANPFVRRAGAELDGEAGTLSVSAAGRCTAGQLDLPIDVTLDRVKVVRAPAPDSGLARMLSGLREPLVWFFGTFAMPRQPLTISQGARITGSVDAPRIAIDEQVVLKSVRAWSKGLAESLIRDPVGTLVPGLEVPLPLPGRTDEADDAQAPPAEDAQTDTTQPEERGGNLLDLLLPGRAEEAPDDRPDETQPAPDKEPDDADAEEQESVPERLLRLLPGVGR